MTNLNQLLNGVEKAKKENMTIVRNGAPNSESFIVIHNEVGYNVEVKDNQITKCSCPHNHFRGVICKHMIKVSMNQNLDIAGLSVESESETQSKFEAKEAQ